MVAGNAGRAGTADPPRLVADAMLGSLARWLRLLGYDTLYMRDADNVIAQRCRAESRILLTRDPQLAERRGLQVILVTPQVLEAQIRQVIRVIGPLDPSVPHRCMTCNVPLQPLSPEAAAPLVPPYVARTQQIFHQCPKCGKITWPGTHWDKIQTRLKEAQDL